MKDATAGKSYRFKPLWRIHNQTYRRYAKGCMIRRFRRYVDKLKGIMGMKH